MIQDPQGPQQMGMKMCSCHLLQSPVTNHIHDVMVLSPDEQHIHTGDTHSTVPASDPDSIDSDNTRSQMSVEESFISIINQLSGESKVMDFKSVTNTS